jgi:hypothetical protein
MTGCKIKHDNPYCSTSEAKLRIDVAYERERIERLKRDTRKSWTRQIQDSQDRIRAVEMGCAVRIGKGARSSRKSNAKDVDT